MLWSVYSMTEQQSYSSSTHFANAKVKSYCIMIIENEQSSEGTEESRDLDIADLAQSMLLISLLLKIIF